MRPPVDCQHSTPEAERSGEGSPTIEADLKTFDQTYGLPDPPSLTIIQPAGPVPPFDPTDGTMVGWAGETTLDVEWAHVFAPGARILLVETPVAETAGVTGFLEIVQAETYVIEHGLGDVISQSFAATEETFPTTTDRSPTATAIPTPCRAMQRVQATTSPADWVRSMRSDS